MSNIPSATALIEINQSDINGTAVDTVNARELHEFLEVGKDFTTWIKDRIEQYNFVENQDFVCSPILGSKGRGGHNRMEYYISIDMAKELAMVERNEKGKQARQYFIECERRAKSFQMPAQITGDFLRQIAANMDRIKAERDEAIRTKAMIGNKREATVMGKLGNAVQKIKRLEDKLGEGETFRAVSAIDWLDDYFDLSGSAESQIGKKLSELSKLHGIEVSTVSHKKYGSVKAYHVDAISKFKQILDLDPSVLAKYRK